MLRISVLNDPSVTRFKLEGKLAHEWVAVAEKAWTALLNISPRSPVVVDLNSVSFVDDPGRDLLAQFHSAGATLIGTGPLIGALIEEITDDGANGRFKPGKWTKGFLGLLLFLLLASLAFGQAPQPAGTSDVLTLEQAVSTALAHNRQLRIAALEVEKAGLDVEIAKTSACHRSARTFTVRACWLRSHFKSTPALLALTLRQGRSPTKKPRLRQSASSICSRSAA